MKELFYTVLYDPLYNALVALIHIVPGADIGIAVIVLTIIVKLILFPLSLKAVRTQLKMKTIQGKVKELQDTYKDNREELGRKMLALYKEQNINPFSGFLLILIQIPIILALYWVFARANFPSINMEILYSFTPVPDTMNVVFLGLADITQAKHAILALGAAITQYLQARFAFPKPEPKKEGEESTFKDDLAKSMSIQIKYVMPVIIFFFAYNLIGAISLYWMVSNLFSIGQELYVRNKIKKDTPEITSAN